MITIYVLLVMAVTVLGNKSYFEVLKHTPCLEKFDLNNCKSDFKMEAFPPMASLKRIYINNCPIPILQNYLFENLTNLNSLMLAGNSIEKLSNETFYNLSGLTELYLPSNFIRVLPEGVLNPLENLELLELSWNSISSLPKDIFMEKMFLKEIFLRGNPLKIVSLVFPIVLNNQLDLSDCRELTDLRLFIQIEYLHLKNSGVERLQLTGIIQVIPHENSKVTRADLSGTYFEQSFEEVLCDMPSIEWLDLSNSSKAPYQSFFQLDESWKECKLPNLRYLYLSGNKLNYIPRRLPLFGPNLTTLDLSNNLLDDYFLEGLFYLDTPRGEEGHFPNLTFLHMGHNKLTEIPRRFPLFGPSLTLLDLSYNLLEVVSLESLAKVHNLQSLYLKGNRLSSFDYLSVCDRLKNLKLLALYDNMFNATFYRNMTKYLGDNGLELI